MLRTILILPVHNTDTRRNVTRKNKHIFYHVFLNTSNLSHRQNAYFNTEVHYKCITL
jgi:hypothetical protein